MTVDNSPTYENLLQHLKNEGSYEEYSRYLFDRYGTRMSGNIYGYSAQYPEGTPKPEKGHTSHLTKGFLDSATQKFVDVQEDPEICDGFMERALHQDLEKKSLEAIYWIAETEKEYNPHPYFRAIDIYYKLNLAPGLTKGEIQEITRDFEEMQSSDQWK